MTMRECYEAIGGNYEDVLGRLHSEALIRRFTLKFLEDQSYLQLKQAFPKVNLRNLFYPAILTYEKLYGILFLIKRKRFR